MDKLVREILRRAQGTWARLVQTTVWLAGSLGAFLLPPPSGTAQEGHAWVRFAQFVITVVVGMLLLASMRWNERKHVQWWVALTALSLVLGTAAFFGYQTFSSIWTTRYNQERVVIGDAYTTLGREYHEKHPQMTPEALVMDVSGKVDRIWTSESLERRRLLLAGIYVLAMPLFTVCIMSIVQAIHCASRKTVQTRKRQPHPA